MSNDRFLSNRSELVLQETVQRMASGGWSFDDAIKITQARLIAKSDSEDAYQRMQIFAAIGEVQDFVAKYYFKEPSLSSLERALNIM